MAKTRIDRVVESIRDRVFSGQYDSHERIPSEFKLQAEYGVSGDTVRKALSRLVAEGVVYRLPWKGTFVSPPAKVGRILVVANYTTVAAPGNFGLLYGFSAFEHGLRCYEDRHELPYALISMDSDTYVRHAHEIHLIHKDIAGIIFFRDFQPLLATRMQLGSLNIPFLFYGSDRYRSQMLGANGYYYEEKELVAAALDYLVEKGHRRILCTLSDVTSRRYRIYEAWMREHGLSADGLIPVVFEDERLTRTPDALLAAGTAILGGRDEEAITVLNSLVRSGVPVPEKMAVVGIDNYPVGMHSVIPLTSVDIPIAADAARCLHLFVDVLRNRRKVIDERSDIKIEIRESA